MILADEFKMCRNWKLKVQKLCIYRLLNCKNEILIIISSDYEVQITW
jgi:hypothetical protein